MSCAHEREANAETAREEDDESIDDGPATTPLVQFVPDDTPTEYMAINAKEPHERFSFPYANAR